MKQILLAIMLAAVLDASIHAQSSYSASPRGKTTVGKSQYTTGHGNLHKKPRNYDQYYYSNVNGYALSPYIVTTPQYMPRTLTPMRPYSDLEYGKIVESFVNAGGVAPAGQTSGDVESVIQPAGDPLFGPVAFRPVESQVMEVLDRGHMLLSTREEVRLRGVRIGSERHPDDINRVYAREAMQRIRQLTQDAPLSLVLDAPLRDSDGVIMVVAKLKDGTDLNQLLLREGLAQIRDTDFAPDVNFDVLKDAEREAREKKRGIWSREMVRSAEH